MAAVNRPEAYNWALAIDQIDQDDPTPPELALLDELFPESEADEMDKATVILHFYATIEGVRSKITERFDGAENLEALEERLAGQTPGEQLEKVSGLSIEQKGALVVLGGRILDEAGIELTH
jgi:hypothetical protein